MNAFRFAPSSLSSPVIDVVMSQERAAVRASFRF
jgi:hypothetical protein